MKHPLALRTALRASLSLSCLSWTAQQVGASSPVETIETDVVIVGAGASGAHAAVRLRDLGQSVVVIEKEDSVGGAVGTYDDPETGLPFNYGVQIFLDYGNATGFFSRFGVDLGPPDYTAWAPQARYYDFTSGASVANYTRGNITAIAPSLAKFAGLCGQHEHLFVPGYWDFPEAAEDIPADLLLPFGEFLRKYDVVEVLPWIWSTTANGVGDITNELTLWVMQAFGCSTARMFLGQQAAYVPTSGRNMDLYDALADFLGDDVLYSTTVVDSTRTDEGVTVVVRNRRTCKTTSVRARHLLIAIPPLGENLAPFRPDTTESRIFGKLHFTREYAGLASHPSLPVGYSLLNMPEAAGANTHLAYPVLNFTYKLESVSLDNDLFRTVVIGDEAFDSEDAAKALVQRNVDLLVGRGVLPPPPQGENEGDVKWVALKNHGAMHAGVSAEELKEGFLREMYSLQGQRSTWYTGATWSAPFQTVLWEFNEVLLPQMLSR